MSSLVDELILAHKEMFEDDRNYAIRRHHVYGMTVKRKLYADDNPGSLPERSGEGFLINGLWLLILTLVPFTTGWVGKAAGRMAAPRVVYSLNILLWALAFSWLEHQVVKENPDVPWDNPSRAVDRRIMYGGFSVCFALSFILRDGVVPLTGIVTVIMLVRALRTGGRRIKEKKKS